MLGRRLRRQRLLSVVGAVALAFGLGPWLGMEGYFFGEPFFHTEFPRLEVVGGHMPELSKLPLEILADLHPAIDDVVHFSGKGPETVRPFVLAAFWLVSATAIFGLALVRAAADEQPWDDEPPGPPRSWRQWFRDLARLEVLAAFLSVPRSPEARL